MGKYEPTRRQWLSVCGTVATLSGCSRLPDLPGLGSRTDTGSREPSAWAMIGNGPTHTGYSPDASLESDAPSEAWSANIGERPYSSPVVAGERVFVTSTEFGIGAFDLSGTRQWRTQSIGIPGATPAVNESATTLFVPEDNREPGDGGGFIRALDTSSGTEQWRTKLGKNDTAVFAPTVVDETVYVCTDTGLVVLDAVDGTIRWRSPSGQHLQRDFYEETKEISPAVADDMVYVPDPDGIRAIDRADHSVVWEKKTGKVRAAPAITDSTVYLTNISTGFYALDRATGDEQWATGLSSLTSPAIADGRVYITKGHQVKVVDAADGRTQGTANFNLRGDIIASIAVGDDFLVTGSGSFGVAVFEKPRGSSFTSELIWKSSGSTQWSPAIANGSIYAVKWSTQLSYVGLFVYQ